MTRTRIARMLLITVGLLLALPVFGQQDLEQIAKMPPRVRAAIQTEFMAKKLNLNAEERTAVEAINVKYADQMQPVLTGKMGPLARMRKAKAIEAAKDGELKKLLTPDQYKTYQASKDELKADMKEKAMSGGGNP